MAQASSSLYSSILLMGPRGIGKTTVGDILSKKCALKRLSVNGYIKGNIHVESESKCEGELFDSTRVMGNVVLREEEKILFLRELLTEFSKKLILDLPCPFGVFSSKTNLEEAKEILSHFKNKFILLPSPDQSESIEFLRNRRELLIQAQDPTIEMEYFNFRADIINRYFLENIVSNQFGANIVYTKDKGPMIIAEEILRYVKK